MKGKYTVLIIIASILTITFSLRSAQSYRIVFCDVGQGAATLIQLGDYQILVDTGPDQRVLSCIGSHIPFFDHTIETVIISHNQKDHNGGLASLQKKYSVDTIYGPPLSSNIPKSLKYTEVQDTVILKINNNEIIIHKASQSSDLNESANVVTIKTPKETLFLTSDINGLELKRLMPENTTILQVPHHGSKYGLYPDSFELALPSLAVISVGKKNTYGHPSSSVLDILKAKNIKVWRTDLNGELEIDL